QAGLAPYIVTQFCFEAQPILDWVRARRADGIDVPIRIGLAGPASITTLMKYALRCGVGNSVRALSLRGTAIARILTENSPDRVVADLARAADASDVRLDGLHF